MTLLCGAVIVVLVSVMNIRRTIRAVRERRGRPAVLSHDRWDAALRALASASPEYAYLQPVPNPRLLSDEELCQAWCASFEAVSNAASARRLKLVSQERRSYLDELERRHPRAVEAWLAGPATAEGNPMPYLRRGFGDLHQEDR